MTFPTCISASRSQSKGFFSKRMSNIPEKNLHLKGLNVIRISEHELKRGSAPRGLLRLQGVFHAVSLAARPRPDVAVQLLASAATGRGRGRRTGTFLFFWCNTLYIRAWLGILQFLLLLLNGYIAVLFSLKLYGRLKRLLLLSSRSSDAAEIITNRVCLQVNILCNMQEVQ